MNNFDFSADVHKGVGRKVSRWGQRKKLPKISKNTEKSPYLRLPEGGGQQKKDRKNSKKDRKIARLSLYLLYLYHA